MSNLGPSRGADTVAGEEPGENVPAEELRLRRQTPCIKPLLAIPDEEDLRLLAANMEPVAFARTLRATTPLLEAGNFRILRCFPLGSEATLDCPELFCNPMGTLQASVYYLLADFAAVIAVVRSLPGLSVAGLHNGHRTQPIQIWTREATIEHRFPATGTIRAEGSVTPDTIDSLRRQLRSAGSGNASSRVTMFQGEQVVAAARVAFHLRRCPSTTPCRS